ncbi:MAG TPA: VOC family protein [Syntrophorhabdaceae bacterium]|jgi:methylmalonyl-CoA/ethylmalonyl-CoA epimerase
MKSADISRIDHVSIAVRDHRKAVDFFCSILGAVPGSSSMDEESKFLGAVLSLGDLSRIEIISPTEEGSFLDPFLASRQGVHHICLQTPDIKKTAALLRSQNIPFFGYDEDSPGEWKDLFIHPRDAFGILIQIAQFDPASFIAEELKLRKDERWRIRREGDAITLTLAHPGGGALSIDLAAPEAAALAKDLEKAIE